MSDSGAPSCLVVASRFREGVIESDGPRSVGGDGNGFHQVGDCNFGAVNGDVNGSSRGAIGSALAEVGVFKRIDQDLGATLALHTTKVRLGCVQSSQALQQYYQRLRRGLYRRL